MFYNLKYPDPDPSLNTVLFGIPNSLQRYEYIIELKVFVIVLMYYFHIL